MKKIVVVIVGLFISVQVSAQDDRGFFYIGPGLSIASAPDQFADSHKTGYNFGGGFGFNVAKGLTVITDVTFNKLSLDETGFLTSLGVPVGSVPTVDGGDVSIYSFMANIMYFLPTGIPDFFPFVTGGAGLYSYSLDAVYYEYQDEPFEVHSDSQTKFGYNFGAGMNFLLSDEYGIFVAGRYFKEKQDFSHLTFSAGLVVPFKTQ
ncbi:outer membrane protein [candidate division KSB1 bacterium]